MQIIYCWLTSLWKYLGVLSWEEDDEDVREEAEKKKRRSLFEGILLLQNFVFKPAN